MTALKTREDLLIEVAALRVALAGAASALHEGAKGAPLSCLRLAAELADRALGPEYVGGVPRDADGSPVYG